ncbi:MAG: hypothetical protein FWG02_03620 [Holophagaceae bacterium]|nr:hypothetical protein [Holophagaceae bacterium]
MKPATTYPMDTSSLSKQLQLDLKNNIDLIPTRDHYIELISFMHSKLGMNDAEIRARHGLYTYQEWNLLLSTGTPVKSTITINQHGIDLLPGNLVTYKEEPCFMLPDNRRLSDDALPKGYYAYEIREDEDYPNRPVQLAKRIHVNYGGTLITRSEIHFQDDFTPIQIEQGDFKFKHKPTGINNFAAFRKIHPPTI